MNDLQSHEFEVFRAGDYGEQGKYSEGDLDDIVSSYDPATVHSAPVVLGHPKTDSPAYGWVESLQRVGNVLKAKAKLIPEMVDWIKRGLYSQRSIALYRDTNSPGGGKPYLKHLGFLGATPPVVKGLAPIELSEHAGQFVEVKFEEKNLKEVKKTMSEPVMFSEAQHQAIVDAELTKKETALRSEFSEALTNKDAEITTLKATNTALQAQVTEFSEKALKADVDNFVDQLVRDGKLEPARKEKVSGSLLKMAKADQALFAEQKEIYSSASKVVEFGEQSGAAGGAVQTDAELERLVGKENAAKYGKVKEFSFGRK